MQISVRHHSRSDYTEVCVEYKGKVTEFESPRSTFLDRIETFLEVYPHMITITMDYIDITLEMPDKRWVKSDKGGLK